MPGLPNRDQLVPTFLSDFSVPLRVRSGKVMPSPPRPLKLADPDFIWTAGYIHARPMAHTVPPRAHPYPAWSTLGSRKDGVVHSEAEVYPNGDAIAVSEVSPFRRKNNMLAIVADRLPEALRPTVPRIFPDDYLSGALVTYPFGQRYGVFEMRAWLPAGQGLWPAFWLLPCDMSWPPEIDVMEVLGHQPNKLFTTVHTKEDGHHQHFARAHEGPDLAQGFNDFTVDWGPDDIVFYLNGEEVFRRPTPRDLHKPCYILANLAVGAEGSWPGAPDSSTVFPAVMTIAHIKAWQRPAYAALP